MQRNADHEIELFVRSRFHGAMDELRQKREKHRLAISEGLVARNSVTPLNPLSPCFDDVEVDHCNAMLQAAASSLIEAYEVYGSSPDPEMWRRLSSHHRQMVDARKNSLVAEATKRAMRTGRNASADVARAEELGRKIERSTGATMKLLACDIEKRKRMSGSDDKQNFNFTQNVFGNVGTVAQGHSVTVNQKQDIFTCIAADINGAVNDPLERGQLLAELATLQQTKDKPSFLVRLNLFLGLASDCAHLAPHISAWTEGLHHAVSQLFK